MWSLEFSKQILLGFVPIFNSTFNSIHLVLVQKMHVILLSKGINKVNPHYSQIPYMQIFLLPKFYF